MDPSQRSGNGPSGGGHHGGARPTPSLSRSSQGRSSPTPALSQLAVSGYRSLRQLTVPLGALTVVCGANGCGKSNLYRSLGLIAAAARGDLVSALAGEGGLPAVFWAGPDRAAAALSRGEPAVQGGPRRDVARLKLGIAGGLLSYAIELGYRADDARSAFVLDPEIKREWIWAGGPFHPRGLLVRRHGALVERCGDGGASPLALEVAPQESLFTAVSDPLEAPEVFQLRRTILSWRFYDSFRTDPGAPARLGRLAPAPRPWRPTAAIWPPPCGRFWRSATARACRPPSAMPSPAAA